ncbi:MULTISPECIES: DMT family transporter [unclassified Paenibacillus]|uniref:DMT family transporter n=1 Tax=unclassified Paenibacillus TaxID=185978 RepID=UPI000CFB3EC9|nr:MULTISPECIES: EamA family transporter [unclassified Paenibacillus]PRA08589.1 EamA family transporter [Paenibacillus sp. MYb63]PRA48522.1 EamA family transporter [Paenibacillus sp. MYb67]QZN78431.1 EamA family transporter [Paenibacillus sp. DR312]
MVGIAFTVMCLIFGTTFLAIKIGVEAGMPPFLSAGLRFVIAGALMFAWMRMKGKVSWSLLFRKEMLITGAGLTFGTFATLYWAEQYVSSGVGAILSATGPLMIMLMQTALLRQKTSARMITGCLIGFAGVVLVVLPGVSIGGSPLWLWGCIAVLVGEVCYSAGAIYSKKVINQFKEANPVAINAVQMMYGGLLLSLLSGVTESWNMSAFDWLPAVSSVIYLTVVGSMVGHSLFYWIMSRTNPLFPATWLYISPPIAVGLGAVVYDEHVSWITWIGVVLVVSGLLAMNEKVSDWLKRGGRSNSLVPNSKTVVK